jgi:steroid 5-alpha reductase family enzyme
LGLFQPSKSLFLAGAVTLWGTRLAGYLFWRVLQTGKDSRLNFLFPKDDKEPLLAGQSK